MLRLEHRACSEAGEGVTTVTTLLPRGVVRVLPIEMSPQILVKEPGVRVLAVEVSPPLLRIEPDVEVMLGDR